MLEPKRILLPIDFSEESLLALDWAVMLAKKDKGATLYLLYILPQDPGTIPDRLNVENFYEPDVVSRKLQADFLKANEEAARKSLESWQKKIPPPLSSKLLISRGNITQEVVRLCDEEDIDLIVITTHGRRGISRLFEGSVSEQISRLAPCPVLVLHLNKSTQRQAPHLRIKSL